MPENYRDLEDLLNGLQMILQLMKGGVPLRL